MQQGWNNLSEIKNNPPLDELSLDCLIRMENRFTKKYYHKAANDLIYASYQANLYQQAKNLLENQFSGKDANEIIKKNMSNKENMPNLENSNIPDKELQFSLDLSKCAQISNQQLKNFDEVLYYLNQNNLIQQQQDEESDEQYFNSELENFFNGKNPLCIEITQEEYKEYNEYTKQQDIPENQQEQFIIQIINNRSINKLEFLKKHNFLSANLKEKTQRKIKLIEPNKIEQKKKNQLQIYLFLKKQIQSSVLSEQLSKKLRLKYNLDYFHNVFSKIIQKEQINNTNIDLEELIKFITIWGVKAINQKNVMNNLQKKENFKNLLDSNQKQFNVLKSGQSEDLAAFQQLLGVIIILEDVLIGYRLFQQLLKEAEDYYQTVKFQKNQTGILNIYQNYLNYQNYNSLYIVSQFCKTLLQQLEQVNTQITLSKSNNKVEYILFILVEYNQQQRGQIYIILKSTINSFKVSLI